LACVFLGAAGLDIGSAEIVVAVPPDRDPEPVRVFATFTPDLHALAIVFRTVVLNGFYFI
jgi:hypothetical protein